MKGEETTIQVEAQVIGTDARIALRKIKDPCDEYSRALSKWFGRLMKVRMWQSDRLIKNAQPGSFMRMDFYNRFDSLLYQNPDLAPSAPRKPKGWDDLDQIEKIAKVADDYPAGLITLDPALASRISRYAHD